MASTIKLGPVTRVEGHLEIEVTVDRVRNRSQVVSAKCSGTMFRGFENILVGRDPRDATHYTQRICGVCPISHGMTSTMALEAAFGIRPPDNGRILRNLVLGSNYLQSHVLHFYHLTLADYVDIGSAVQMSPWLPRYVTRDSIRGTEAGPFIDHYLQALAIRRQAHQMGAIFGGKMPCSPTLVPGGCTEVATTANIASFQALLSGIRTFINNVYIPDVQKIMKRFPEYSAIGAGCRNLLAYGVFDQNASGTNKLLKRGRYTNGSLRSVDAGQIAEYVGYSWYKGPAGGGGQSDDHESDDDHGSSGGVNPSNGVTDPDVNKAGAYSFVKAPRYLGVVHEVGPLARMWVNGDYRRGPSVVDRLMARALETKKVADAMNMWLTQLVNNGISYVDKDTPTSATGIGLSEAPRGALGHWMQISGGKIGHYQVITPTAWNCSPRDDNGKAGAMEQALIGTPVQDLTAPNELLRVVHSFDPCLSCSVHMARPGRKAEVVVTA
jgi:hydrogenase large subunit